MCFSRRSETQQEMNFLIVWTPNYIQFVPLTFFLCCAVEFNMNRSGSKQFLLFFCFRRVDTKRTRERCCQTSPKTISQWNDHSSQPQITQLTFINEIAFNSVPSSLRRDHEKHQKKRATGECVEKVSCIDAGRGGVCSTHEKSRVEVFLSTFPNLATHLNFLFVFVAFDTIPFAHIGHLAEFGLPLAASWLPAYDVNW